MKVQREACDNILGVLMNDAGEILPHYYGYHDAYGYTSEVAGGESLTSLERGLDPEMPRAAMTTRALPETRARRDVRSVPVNATRGTSAEGTHPPMRRR